MAYEDIKEYISKIPTNPLTSLVDIDLDKVIYQATEELNSFYHKRHITSRAIVLQAIYNYEAAGAEYEMLRRQGISSLSTKRGSVTFDTSDSGGSRASLAPQVVDLLGSPPAFVGRLS